MSTQLLHTLREAAGTIRALRRQNEILSAQVAVVEVFAAATGLRKERGGMSPDVACELDKLAEQEQKRISEEQLNRAAENTGEGQEFPPETVLP